MKVRQWLKHWACNIIFIMIRYDALDLQRRRYKYPNFVFMTNLELQRETPAALSSAGWHTTLHGRGAQFNCWLWQMTTILLKNRTPIASWSPQNSMDQARKFLYRIIHATDRKEKVDAFEIVYRDHLFLNILLFYVKSQQLSFIATTKSRSAHVIKLTILNWTSI